MVTDPRLQYGDPYQIKRLASDLIELADQLTSGAQTVKKYAEMMGFEGPKAERFRDRVVAGREKAGNVASELTGLANSLQLIAAAAEANIEAYKRAVEYDPYADL